MAPTCKLCLKSTISNASPATVSRMGMVYISSSALSWKPILQVGTGDLVSVFPCLISLINRDSVSLLWRGWKKRTTQENNVFLTLYDKIFEDAYTYMKLNLNPKMQLLEYNYIVQVRFFFVHSLLKIWNSPTSQAHTQLQFRGLWNGRFTESIRIFLWCGGERVRG